MMHSDEWTDTSMLYSGRAADDRFVRVEDRAAFINHMCQQFPVVTTDDGSLTDTDEEQSKPADSLPKVAKHNAARQPDANASKAKTVAQAKSSDDDSESESSDSDSDVPRTPSIR